MSEIKWVDGTSYSQGQTDRTPMVWHTEVGAFRVSVHRHIHYEPDVWLLSTFPNLFDNDRLKSADLKEAQSEALAKLRAACSQTIKEIDQ